MTKLPQPKEVINNEPQKNKVPANELYKVHTQNIIAPAEIDLSKSLKSIPPDPSTGFPLIILIFFGN